MERSTAIRILEGDNNRRGDLFGRLMAKLFVALGYQQPVINVHKAGREVDLSADHRLEARRAIAECKATVEPIGGNDLNKFVGVLDAEDQDERQVTGYFISLAGFKETALEQERQRRRTKIITLTASQVVSQLIQGKLLVSVERATELAGRLCAGFDHLVLDPSPDLLAHERGLMWAVYYTQGKVRTHLVLIHSDGTPLARSLADEVVSADRKCGGGLHRLVCLNPFPILSPESDQSLAEAISAYKKHLVQECGYVYFDGLPADNDVVARRLRLGSLFVPPHLDVAGWKQRQPVGDVLTWHPRLALLAPAGSGKSILIKHLAVSYADPSWLEQRTGDLPQRDWLPVVIRCRELRHFERGSLADFLDSLSQRETLREHTTVFRPWIDRAFVEGRILLLVDGLDEICDSSERDDFVRTLRTTLEAYPGTALVVTSRVSGFRHLAAHLSPICTHATFSLFNEDEIRRLCVAWSREVTGNAERAAADAEQLAAVIVAHDYLRQLATNPLLLTTLLLVQRWIGILPARRTLLYQKAVEVLLMTWSVESYEPISYEEALPQLCYVASAMMLNGMHQISRPGLVSLLEEARGAMPTEAMFLKGNVDSFINQVEERNGLLLMTGHIVENGRLVESFGFCHLTFQEFLTAVAMANGWHPGRKHRDTSFDALVPHLDKPEWKEVILMAMDLGGKTGQLIADWIAQSPYFNGSEHTK